MTCEAIFSIVASNIETIASAVLVVNPVFHQADFGGVDVVFSIVFLLKIDAMPIIANIQANAIEM